MTTWQSTSRKSRKKHPRRDTEIADASQKVIVKLKGTAPKHSGTKTIAYTHAVLGASLAWLEQMKQRCETIALNYIRHEDANVFCMKAITRMEEKMKDTEEAVCKVQAMLGYTCQLQTPSQQWL